MSTNSWAVTNDELDTCSSSDFLLSIFCFGHFSA